MSADPLRADMRSVDINVRYVPLADIDPVSIYSRDLSQGAPLE
jgi:hypothetical protein